MVSYFKTQWFSFLVGLVYLGVSIYYFIQNDALEAIGNLLVAVVWLILSRVDYNNDRIAALEKKSKKYDAIYDLVQELLDANKIDRQFADHINKKIDSFIVDHKKKEKLR